MASTLQRLQDWVNVGLDLAFPWPEHAESAPQAIEEPLCQKCGEPFPGLSQETSFICSSCAGRSLSFDWARSGYRMEGEVREAIIGFKYGEQFYRRAQLVSWLGATYDRFGREKWDGLVPVPLYRLRKRGRGFNQAEELAEGLKKSKSVRVINCLYRCRETAPQVRLRRTMRWENLKGAFELKPGFDVRGLHLLLVDDVFTTGATADACAQALRSGGAARVAVLTVARS